MLLILLDQLLSEDILLIALSIIVRLISLPSHEVLSFASPGNSFVDHSRNLPLIIKYVVTLRADRPGVR